MSGTPRRRKVAVALVIVFIGAPALLLVGPDFFERFATTARRPPPAWPHHASVPPRLRVPHVPLIAPAADPGSGYTPGAQRSYFVDMQIEAALEAGTSNANNPPAAAAMQLSLKGQWVETFVGGLAGIATYHVALSDSKVLASGQPVGALKGELETPFYIERDRGGAVQGFYFEGTTNVVARGILKSAASMRQILVRTGPQWNTTEVDSTGEYEAHYTRGSNPLEIGKRRIRYTRLSTARGLRPTADVGTAEVKDETRIKLTEDQELERLDSKTLTKVRIGEGLPTAVGKLVGSFVFRDRRFDASMVDDFDRNRGALQRVELLEKPDVSPTAEAWRESDAQIVGTTTLADIVAALEKIPVDDRRGRAEAMAKLRADFRLRALDTNKAAAVVETAPVEDGKAITAALGGAGSPQAQRALVNIVDNPRVPLPVRLNASTAVLLLEQPTREVASELIRQMNDPNEHIRGASSLALGSVLAHLPAADRAEHDSGFAALMGNFENATTREEQIIALRALGNSGDLRVARLALQAYADEDIELRVAAVHAVRFVPGAQADELISQAMLHDPQARVRIEAIETVTAHRFVPAYFAAYDTVLAADQFPLVRRAAVQSLSKASDAPQAIALLQRAETDSSDDVRVVAKMALHSSSSASR